MAVSSKRKKLLISIAVILLIMGIWYWRHTIYYPSTDDAYIQANIINIAPQVSGQVITTYVINNQHVQRGQPIFDLDPAPYKIAVANARAQLALAQQQVGSYTAAVDVAKALIKQREAELENSQKNYTRIIALVKKNFIPLSQGDDAAANLKVATAALSSAKNQLLQAEQQLGEMGNHNAQIRAARANLNQAKLNLFYTHIYAPKSGYISNYYLRVGNVLGAGQPQFALVEDNYWWVDTNLKETDLERIKINQPAKIHVDIYPHHVFHGVVESISRGSGATFSLLPPENATGNWVKITQRFTVRVKITDVVPDYPLRVGASSKVTIDTTS